MHELVRVISEINVVLYAGLAVVMGRDWLRRHDRPTMWAAAAFGALGFVAVLGRLVPKHPDGVAEVALQRIDVAGLVVFPYLLYRFAMAFGQRRGRFERLIALLTIALLAATAAIPHFPEEGDAQPWWFRVYVVWFLVHWAVLAVLVAVRLWRSGKEQPHVAQRRMRALTVASMLLTAAIFLLAFSTDPHSAGALVVQLLAAASGVIFFVALSPPAVVRLLWRRGDQARMQTALIGLVRATDVDEIVSLILPPIGAAIGARALTLKDAVGDVVGVHGAVPDEQPTLKVAMSQGELLVWATPFAPFFGEDELRLTQTLGELTSLAIDRARLFAREREGRLALEQANRLMTNFVALAAHELRTPVTTISGSAQTLRERAHELTPEHREALEGLLQQESERLRRLIEQLLDLSRLDASAIEIAPQELPLRERVEQIVAGAAGALQATVDVKIDRALVVRADQTALERIVGNLVANALRHGEAPVVVSAEPSDHHLRLRVVDHGPGVAEEFVPDLFERFSRSRQTKAAGTGLGLAIARAYARAHDGELLYAPTPGGGACFELVLPQA